MSLIDEYENGGHELRSAVRGLTADDLIAVPIPGKWSIGGVVIHLADAEAAFADRIKRVIATDNPPLLAWDENQFLARLHYDKQSADDAVTLIELTRRQTSKILRAIPASDFKRTGNHSEAGPITLEQIVAKANSHLHHHLMFVADKREAMGKLMW